MTGERPTRADLGMAELARGQVAERLRREHDATAEHGLPTTLAPGIHLAGLNVEEIAAMKTAYERDASITVKNADAFAPERLPLFETAHLLANLQASDRTLPNGLLPLGVPPKPGFGMAIMVEGGMAIGHLLLFDSHGGTPGAVIDFDHVPSYDVLSNAWVAHDHRGRGVARDLLAYVRDRYPIVELQRPFTAAGAAWIRRYAPDLIDVGRNDPCPCRSGKKAKHCHGRRVTG